MVKETLVSRKVISWWKYNPLLQKPASLDPVRPWAWYWYYGPDPASGCSYGQYHDEENDFDMITAKDNIVYSPATGKPMEFICPVPEEEFNEKVTKVTGDQFKGCQAICTSCQADLVSDYDLSEVDKVHCVKCGGVCEISAMDTKTIKGEKTMTSVREERVQNLKRRIRANILKKRRAEAIKDRRAKIEEEQRKKKKEVMAEKTRLTLKNQKRIRAEEEEKEKEEDELISLDTIMEAMDEEEANEEVAAEDVEEDVEDVEDVTGEEEGEELDFEEPEEDLEVEEPEAEEPEMDFEEELSGPVEESEEVPEGEDEDEYYDLDMVLSMINKKEKLARKKKAKAEEEKKEEVKEEEEEEVCEDDVCEAEEDDLEEKDKEVETEDALLEEEEEEEVVEEKPAEEVPPKEDLAAMKFEPLAALDTLAKVRKEDIDMSLYHEDSDNPTWNIAIAGVPTARIQLKKQSAPDEIRAVFCSEDYAKDLMIHCEKTGFIQTMNKVKADFWANHTSNKKIAERFTKEAKASFEGERKKLLASFKQTFRNCMNIVSAGMSKNFYPDMGNALKEHMFTNLRTVGLPEQTAISVVEKSFAEGSAPYFDALFEKSEEYMNLTADARKEIAAAISHGASLEHKLEDAEPATLSERVAQASIIANTVSGTPLRVTRDVVLDSNEYKAQLRSVWRK